MMRRPPSSTLFPYTTLSDLGGQGSRMDVLTRERAKPALPFGGVHRLVDFALSALYHAEIDDVWVSVQYQVASIDEDRKSTRLNSSHVEISYAVFCLKKKKKT